MRIRNYFLIAATIVAMAISTFGQTKAKLPKGATLVDDAKQQELLQQIDQMEQSNPASKATMANQMAGDSSHQGNSAAANIEVDTLPGGEVVARVNLAGVAPFTHMVVSREYQGKEEFMQGISFFGGCNGCSFDIEAGRKITWMDRPGFANYRAYFFSDGNLTIYLAQKGINGPVAHRFLQGNPRENGRRVEIQGSFNSPVVVSFRLRSVEGSVHMVTEPDVRVRPNRISIDLNSEPLRFMSPGDYVVTVGSGGYSNTAHMHLALDGSTSVTSPEPDSGPTQSSNKAKLTSTN